METSRRLRCAPPGWSALRRSALGLMGDFTNVVNCALFDTRVRALDHTPALDMEKLIAVISTTRDLLDSGHWKVIGSVPIVIAKRNWPNEQYARKGYGGAATYGSAIINNFAAAYFDKLLVSPNKKPPSSTLMFKEP